MLNYSESLDSIFRALADPTRRGIVERLADGSLSVSALAKHYPVSLQAVMQHLQVLEESNIVKSEKVGRTRTYSIEPWALETIESWIDERRKGWERNLDRLGEYLTAGEDEGD